jgi:hypothetical protein
LYYQQVSVPVAPPGGILDELSDRAAIGRQWAAEIGGGRDDTLVRMLEYLEKADAA